MNNKVKPTDTQKLLDWIALNEKEYYDTKDVFNALERAIESGVLAIDTPPVPTIKPGDKVIHSDLGEGTAVGYGEQVIEISTNKGNFDVSVKDLEVVE